MHLHRSLPSVSLFTVGKDKDRRIKLQYTTVVLLQYSPDDYNLTAGQCVSAKRCNVSQLQSYTYTLPFHMPFLAEDAKYENCLPLSTMSAMLSDSCRACCIHRTWGQATGQRVLIAVPSTVRGTSTVGYDTHLQFVGSRPDFVKAPTLTVVVPVYQETYSTILVTASNM